MRQHGFIKRKNVRDWFRKRYCQIQFNIYTFMLPFVLSQTISNITKPATD